MNVQAPDLSLVIPCYNEADCIEATAVDLAEAFQKARVRLELVLVDNGSTDGTSDAIDRLVSRSLPGTNVTKVTVPINRGQGLGLITGLARGRGRFVGYVCADGQVSAQDVVDVYQLLTVAVGPTLAKARRRYRKDSWIRKPVSLVYNAMMLLLFPGLSCLDVNGNPKMMPAEILKRMDLQSHDWFLEAEVMLKARHLRLRVVEIDVFGRARRASRSHVRAGTILEFLRNIIAYRFGGPWRDWRKRTAGLPAEPAPAPSSIAHG